MRRVVAEKVEEAIEAYHRLMSKHSRGKACVQGSHFLRDSIDPSLWPTMFC